MFFRNQLAGLIDRGDFDAIQRLEHDLGAKNLPPDYVGSGPLAAALEARSVAAAKRSCTGVDDFWLGVRCMLVLSSLGDQDGAYTIADKLYPRRTGRTPAETERMWLDDPSASRRSSSSRRLRPRRCVETRAYLALLERVGLLDYWRSGRPPDFCRKRREPVCVQLLKRNR